MSLIYQADIWLGQYRASLEPVYDFPALLFPRELEQTQCQGNSLTVEYWLVLIFNCFSDSLEDGTYFEDGETGTG